MITYEEAKREFGLIMDEYQKIDADIRANLATNPVKLFGITGEIIRLGKWENEIIADIRSSFPEGSKDRKRLRVEYAKLDAFIKQVQANLKTAEADKIEDTIGWKRDGDAPRQTP